MLWGVFRVLPMAPMPIIARYDGSHVILYGHAQAPPSYFLVERIGYNLDNKILNHVNLVFINGVARLGYLVY